MPLYLYLLLGSILIPFALSFDKKLHFYTSYRYLLPSIFAVALFYILVDVFFTRNGIWGFNSFYTIQFNVLDLPIEEWLFFIVIPYASIFLHESIVLYFPKFVLTTKTTRVISFLLFLLFTTLLISNSHKAYTLYVSLLVLGGLGWSFFDKSKLLNHYYLTFLIILIPFVIVNSILTGSFIEGEVVWYNNAENLGIRFLTIPVEDFGYGFTLILYSLLLSRFLKLNFFKTIG